jgi:hypothetical protein
MRTERTAHFPWLHLAVGILAVFTSWNVTAQLQTEMAPAIQANSNRVPAAKLEHGIQTLHLELRQGDWYPEADTGPSVKVHAFAEEGKKRFKVLIPITTGTRCEGGITNTTSICRMGGNSEYLPIAPIRTRRRLGTSLPSLAVHPRAPTKFKHSNCTTTKNISLFRAGPRRGDCGSRLERINFWTTRA